MRFLKRAASLFRNRPNESAGESVVNDTVSLTIGGVKGLAFLPIIIPIVGLLLIVITLLSTFNNKIQLMQMVDPYNYSNVGVNLNYDFEEYLAASDAAYESGNIPSTDLSSTDYKTVEAFNKHIKDSVSAAGFGTREGVIAAGMSLIGDYIKATGKRLRYDQGQRQYYDGGNNEGIINSNFYLDCSSFSWWALYNGGFKIPCWPYTGTQMQWAISNGLAERPGEGRGKGGDFLVSDGHIVLIVGNYDGGYYCAEEAGWGTGAIIRKRSFDGLGAYTLINMDKYYADSSNVRNQS